MSEWYCAGCGENEVSERGAFCDRCCAEQDGADLAAENARLRQQITIAREALITIHEQKGCYVWVDIQQADGNDVTDLDWFAWVAGNALAALEDNDGTA